MSTGLAGAVLAAGSGTRMGAPKGTLVVGGMRLVDRAVAAVRGGGCAPVLAVVRTGVAVAGAEPVVNPDPDRGMRSSLELAVAAAGSAGAEGLLVCLVDTPGVGSDAVRAVAAAYVAGRIAVASYDGVRGHPIAMSIELWRDALAMAGPDEGARALLAARAHLVDAVAVAGDPIDLDTPADVAGWQG